MMLNTNQANDLFHIILDSYALPNRYYHGLNHIMQCLNEFDTCRHLVTHEQELEIAIWMHDLIYIPAFPHNEALSAAAAYAFVYDLTASSSMASQVRNNILATGTHSFHPPNLSQDAKLLMDIDLSILGQDEKTFWEYETNIQKEHSFLTDETYKHERTAVLNHFLSRTSIFSSYFFQKKYEEKARYNITALLSKLTFSL